jgi:hypothetical protein
VIELTQPALVLHACDVSATKYQMWQTRQMPAMSRVVDLVNWIIDACNRSPAEMLHNVVIHAYGDGDRLLVGGRGYEALDPTNSDRFAALAGKVGTIWLVARSATGGGQGLLCRRLSDAAGCRVVATGITRSAGAQFDERWCPYGSIDAFEEAIFCWDTAVRAPRPASHAVADLELIDV